MNAPEQYSPLAHVPVRALPSAEHTLPSCSQQPSWAGAGIDTAWILQHYKHQAGIMWDTDGCRGGEKRGSPYRRIGVIAGTAR